MTAPIGPQTEEASSLDAPKSVGEILRRRREELGWSVSDVATWSRIQENYIEALETGQYDLLPAEVYALGFLRTYAHLLGFDPSSLVECYRQESRTRHCRQSSLNFPTVIDSRRLTPAISILLGLLIIIASYVGWYHFTVVTPALPDHIASTNDGPFLQQGIYTLSPHIVTMLPDQGEAPPPRPQQNGNGSLNGQGNNVNNIQENGIVGKKEPTPFVLPAKSDSMGVTGGNSLEPKQTGVKETSQTVPIGMEKIPPQMLPEDLSLSQKIIQEEAESKTPIKMPLKSPKVKTLQPVTASSAPILSPHVALTDLQTVQGKNFQQSQKKLKTTPKALTTDDLNARQLKKLGVQGW